MLPLRVRAVASDEAVKALWRNSGKDGAEAAGATFVRAELETFAFT